MECLAAFVLLVMLPLTVAALGLALRANGKARDAARETQLLAQTVTGLAARLRREEIAVRAPARRWRRSPRPPARW